MKGIKICIAQKIKTQNAINMNIKKFCNHIRWILTDSNNEDVTTALVDPPVLMFAQTGAPKPMEESCRLEKECK